MRHKKDSELYLKMYPELLKWINECPLCHCKGYKPEIPEQIGGEYSSAGNNIRKYFNPLKVDDKGLCLQCLKIYNQKREKD